MTTPDFRALCAELIEKIDYTWGDVPEDVLNLMNCACNALAEPVGEEPTDEELLKTYCDARRAFYFEAAEGESDQEDRKAATIAGLRAALARWGHPTPPAPVPETLAEALAARPLLEKVARLGDCIGQQTVGQVRQLAGQAAAWLRGNPPGQPVAIEPRGCPAPGACSCVEPPAAPPAPAGGLVERVEAVIRPSIPGVPNLYRYESRAAIREVAAWLDQRGLHGCARWLREEAGRA
jgi:hypothetical protein